ncbi:anti-phage dCTP deaminase [Vibrio harveyi]|uniref:anti-phage dCTP deaminase n=2 Tax=Vibrio harveyi TaxID=669 RepID=UPI000C7AA726|nr:anti-phage dCTP deaminase [Vibrio harveyi]AWA98888.1 cytidine deaminase [Vibrio harveyi]HEQ3587953.1 cytidine deaminase [Vibrio harveyi]HEQ3594791.1 cytidine deaminase [Vibrio harveyi]HEQ3606712.1 cytidine deaminase [Vibrio harveyi]
MVSKETDENVLHEEHLNGNYSDSEIVIGLVGAVGTELTAIKQIIKERLETFNYTTEEVRISTDIISLFEDIPSTLNHYEKADALMSAGNTIRKKSGDNSILALAAASQISCIREANSKGNDPEPLKRKAFIISSLKHPEEVQKLRTIYSRGFFLIGIHSSEARRRNFLMANKNMSKDEANILIKRDADESDKHGQHTRDTYHLSDFFIDYGSNRDKAQYDIWRTLDLMFGKPFVTPTFDEFAMFMAFSSSLRSADLSRQVGAVMTKNKNIISTGANDIPQAGGGLYWPDYDSEGEKIIDKENGRDWKRGYDSNTREKKMIINDILDTLPDDEHKEPLRKLLNSSRIKDITEYGRVVHAEMEAILACARSDISTKDAELYCTTFPCHNCAKHIVASGIKRVVYVEPYPKSKALDFHSDSITLELDGKESVRFEPFVGVGPRSFYDLFSTNLGAGYPIKRKDPNGEAVKWKECDAVLRMQMLSTSYIERETAAASAVSDYRSKYNESK